MNSNVFHIAEKKAGKDALAKGNDSGDGGGGDDMEQRVQKLESAISGIQQDVAVIKSNYATEKSVSDLRTELKVDISRTEKSVSDLRTELKVDISRTEKSVSDLRSEIYKAISEQTKVISDNQKIQIRWSVGIIITILLSAAGLLFSK